MEGHLFVVGGIISSGAAQLRSFANPRLSEADYGRFETACFARCGALVCHCGVRRGKKMSGDWHAAGRHAVSPRGRCMDAVVCPYARALRIFQDSSKTAPLYLAG